MKMKKRRGYLQTKFIQFLIENEKVKADKMDDEIEDDADEVDDEIEDDADEVDDEIEDDADEVIERLVQKLRNTAKQYDDILQRQKTR
jgi:hypothetical protein